MYRYLIIEEKLFSNDIGSYTSFGIQTQELYENTWADTIIVSDVSVNRLDVEKLCEILNQYQPDFIHLFEIISDFI